MVALRDKSEVLKNGLALINGNRKWRHDCDVSGNACPGLVPQCQTCFTNARQPWFRDRYDYTKPVF